MSGMFFSSFDLMKPPASAIVEVNNPVLAKIYFNISNGNLKKIDFKDIPISSIELYL